MKLNLSRYLVKAFLVSTAQVSVLNKLNIYYVGVAIVSKLFLFLSVPFSGWLIMPRVITYFLAQLQNVVGFCESFIYHVSTSLAFVLF